MATAQLKAHIDEGESILADLRSGGDDDTRRQIWASYCEPLLDSILENSPSIVIPTPIHSGLRVARSRTDLTAAAVDKTEQELTRLRSVLKALPLYQSQATAAVSTHGVRDAATVVERLCNRFPLVIDRLARRRAGRTPLVIDDEYDVQYLFGALLRLDFDDIRDEEWTPSYAGGHSRIDFLLKAERLVVEIKMTREGLDDRKVGDELIIDIARYATHPNCSELVCFVYDPSGRLKNPRGLETDLTKRHNALEVKVFVRPRR